MNQHIPTMCMGGGKVQNKTKITKRFKDNIIKNVINLIKLGKENKGIKDTIIRDVSNLFDHEEDY